MEEKKKKERELILPLEEPRRKINFTLAEQHPDTDPQIKSQTSARMKAYSDQQAKVFTKYLILTFIRENKQFAKVPYFMCSMG